MIYCMNIQDIEGSIIARVVFDLHKDGIDVEGYTVKGERFPACTVWHFFEHLGTLIDVDALAPKTRTDIETVARLLASSLVNDYFS